MTIRSHFGLLFTVGIAFAGLLGAAAVASAKNASNDHAPMVHVGLNPFTCGTVAGTDSGVANVHFNSKQDRLKINISVHNALPNATYSIHTRCVNFLGTLTTNSQGTGTAHITREDLVVPPAGPFFVDISISGGGGGAGNFGDTFIAGPFDLD